MEHARERWAHVHSEQATGALSPPRSYAPGVQARHEDDPVSGYPDSSARVPSGLGTEGGGSTEGAYALPGLPTAAPRRALLSCASSAGCTRSLVESNATSDRAFARAFPTPLICPSLPALVARQNIARRNH